MRNLSADTYQAAFEKLSAFWEKVPEARGSAIELELLGKPAAGAIPDDDTAYPWRDAIAYTWVAHILMLESLPIIEGVPNYTASMFQMAWTEASVEEQANTLARELRDDFVATSGYDGLAAYVSYAHGDESLAEMYGERKLERLAGLKSSWDPDNVFGFNNALPRE